MCKEVCFCISTLSSPVSARGTPFLFPSRAALAAAAACPFFVCPRPDPSPCPCPDPSKLQRLPALVSYMCTLLLCSCGCCATQVNSLNLGLLCPVPAFFFKLSAQCGFFDPAVRRVGKQVVNIPSFMVRVDSQKHIDFALTSPFGGGRPGRVKRKSLA